MHFVCKAESFGLFSLLFDLCGTTASELRWGNLRIIIPLTHSQWIPGMSKPVFWTI